VLAKLAAKPAPFQYASDRNDHDIDLALLRLAARESARGFNHPDVASELHLLGALHHEAGRYNEALAFYATALAIRQRTLGRDHSELASTLVDLEAARRDEADEEKHADMASRRTDPERAEVGA
jgi:tetratricopeptide (TPR) repeat protein